MANVTTADFFRETLQTKVLLEADIVVVGRVPWGHSASLVYDAVTGKGKQIIYSIVLDLNS
jgi:hypothetical protein